MFEVDMQMSDTASAELERLDWRFGAQWRTIKQCESQQCTTILGPLERMCGWCSGGWFGDTAVLHINAVSGMSTFHMCNQSSWKLHIKGMCCTFSGAIFCDVWNSYYWLTCSSFLSSGKGLSDAKLINGLDYILLFTLPPTLRSFTMHAYDDRTDFDRLVYFFVLLSRVERIVTKKLNTRAIH